MSTPTTQFTARQSKARCQQVEKQYKNLHHIKNLSGAGWDPVMYRFARLGMAWNELIAKDPEIAFFRNCTFYQQVDSLLRGSIPTGRSSVVASEAGNPVEEQLRQPDFLESDEGTQTDGFSLPGSSKRSTPSRNVGHARKPAFLDIIEAIKESRDLKSENQPKTAGDVVERARKLGMASSTLQISLFLDERPNFIDSLMILSDEEFKEGIEVHLLSKFDSFFNRKV